MNGRQVWEWIVIKLKVKGQSDTLPWITTKWLTENSYKIGFPSVTKENPVIHKQEENHLFLFFFFLFDFNQYNKWVNPFDLSPLWNTKSLLNIFWFRWFLFSFSSSAYNKGKEKRNEMKFLFEFVSCCGFATLRTPERAVLALEEERSFVPEAAPTVSVRRPRRKRQRMGSAEWKPSLGPISEDGGTQAKESPRKNTGTSPARDAKKRTTAKVRYRSYSDGSVKLV